MATSSDEYSRYKTPWKEFSKNEEFWKEVLVGRTITDVKFTDEGFDALVLDSGEHIYVVRNGDRATICIKDGMLPKKENTNG